MYCNYWPLMKCPFMAHRPGKNESGMYKWFRVWGCAVWLGVNMTTECNWGSALLFVYYVVQNSASVLANSMRRPELPLSVTFN